MNKGLSNKATRTNSFIRITSNQNNQSKNTITIYPHKQLFYSKAFRYIC
jgi:hypothetical protein